MSEEFDVFEVEEKPAKPAPKPKPEVKDDEAKLPENLTPERLAEIRRDIRRMWNPEPEETR